MTVDTTHERSPARDQGEPALGLALSELHEASGADAVVWLQPAVVAGDLWWARVVAVGDADLVRCVASLRGMRVVTGDHGGAVSDDDDVKPPMPTPPWLMVLRDARFRRLDPDVTARLIGCSCSHDGADDHSPGGLCALVGDVTFAAWYAGAAVTGVLAMVRRVGGGRLSRHQVERGSAALQSPMSLLAAAEGATYFIDGDRTLHVITDLDGEIEGFSEAVWDRISRPERDQLRALAASFHASERQHDTVICALAAIRLERLACGDGSRTLIAIQPASKVLVGAVDRLTLRQREIVGYAAAGSTLAEIARSLELSPHTVKYHLKGAYEVLGVASRVELLALLRNPS